MKISWPHKTALIAIVAIICAGLMISALPARAQMDDSVMESPDIQVTKPKAALKVSPLKINFGTHKTGSVSTRKFSIKNKSKTLILMGSVGLPSVPPLVIVSGGGAFALSPKGKMTVVVQFAPGLIQGDVKSTIEILSNDPLNKKLTITLTAKAVSANPIK